MGKATREKLATQVKTEILSKVLNPVQSGRRSPEALADLIEKRKQNHPRSKVMATYQASHEKFGPLYKKLAE